MKPFALPFLYTHKIFLFNLFFIKHRGYNNKKADRATSMGISPSGRSLPLVELTRHISLYFLSISFHLFLLLRHLHLSTKLNSKFFQNEAGHLHITRAAMTRIARVVCSLPDVQHCNVENA